MIKKPLFIVFFLALPVDSEWKHSWCYDSKFGLGCNLGKDLGKSREDD